MLKIGAQNPIRLNLLILGPSGSGKRTFLKALFQEYTSMEVKLSNESDAIKLCEISSFGVVGDTGWIKFHVYDAPGYGDAIDNSLSFQTLAEELTNRHITWRNIDGQLLADNELMDKGKITNVLRILLLSILKQTNAFMAFSISFLPLV
jgi:septin family protein